MAKEYTLSTAQGLIEALCDYLDTLLSDTQLLGYAKTWITDFLDANAELIDRADDPVDEAREILSYSYKNGDHWVCFEDIRMPEDAGKLVAQGRLGLDKALQDMNLDEDTTVLDALVIAANWYRGEIYSRIIWNVLEMFRFNRLADWCK